MFKITRGEFKGTVLFSAIPSYRHSHVCGEDGIYLRSVRNVGMVDVFIPGVGEVTLKESHIDGPLEVGPCVKMHRICDYPQGYEVGDILIDDNGDAMPIDHHNVVNGTVMACTVIGNAEDPVEISNEMFDLV